MKSDMGVVDSILGFGKGSLEIIQRVGLSA